jgi:hypothetical protein
VLLNPIFDSELIPFGDDVDEVEGARILLTISLLLVFPPAPKKPTAGDVVVELEGRPAPAAVDVVRAVPVLVVVLLRVLTIVVLEVCVPVPCVDAVVLRVVKTRPTPPPVSAPSVVVATALRCVDVVVPGAVKPKNGVPVVNGSPKNGLPAIRSGSQKAARDNGCTPEKCAAEMFKPSCVVVSIHRCSYNQFASR